MKIKSLYSLLFLSLMLLFSCKKEKTNEISQNVNLNTKGIYIPVSVKHQGLEVSELIDLDEYELGSGAQLFSFSITNNTAFPMTEIDVKFPDQDPNYKAFDYMVDPEEVIAFPGHGGTCQRVLPARASCIINLMILAPEELGMRLYLQKIRVEYKNLIEQVAREFTLRIYAGFAASLIFDNNPDSNFWFGDKVGLSQIPVLERAERITLTRNIIVRNAGDLRARNVVVSLPPQDITCFANLVSTTCVGAEGESFYQQYSFNAWQVQHNCPAVLEKDETCEVNVSFTVLNQDPDVGPPSLALQEIIHNATARLDYLSSPELRAEALNAYFNTVTTTIAARFDTSISSQKIDDAVIVGNRDKRGFKVDNKGYRHGRLHKIIIKDNTDNNQHLATCVYDITTNPYLKCFEEDLVTPVALETFPFYFRDIDACFSDNPIKYVNVDSGCVIDVYFQPSIKIQSEKEYDVALWVEYDNQYKGVETIVSSYLHDFIATALPAAKVRMKSLTFGKVDLPVSAVWSDDDFHQETKFDLGRLALQIPSKARRTALRIALENIGGSDATQVKAFHGRLVDEFGVRANGIEIPTQTSPINIGTSATHPFYKNVFINSASCSVISPGGTCTIEIEYSSISLNNECNEMLSMFDFHADCDDIDSLTLAQKQEFYKKFTLAYEDGAKYSDENLYSTTKDIPKRLTDTRIHGVLVRKGYLDQFHDQDILNSVKFGQIKQYHLKFENIGTGTIPYFAWRGDTFDPYTTRGVYFRPTLNPATYGGHKDCLDLFDFSSLPTDLYADIMARKAGVSPTNTNDKKNAWVLGLASEEVCILTVELNPSRSALPLATEFQSSVFSNGGQSAEMRRFVSNVPIYDYDANTDSHNLNVHNDVYLSRNIISQNTLVDLAYYDGDVDVEDPYVIGLDETNPEKHFGRYQDKVNTIIDEMNLGASFVGFAYWTIGNSKPYTSSIIYRNEINTTEVLHHETSTTVRPVYNRVMTYWWGPGNRINDNDEFNYKYTLPSFYSIQNSDISSLLLASNSFHSVHFGTFDSQDKMSLSFDFIGYIDIRILSEELTGGDKDYFTMVHTPLPDDGLSMGQGANGQNNTTRGLEFEFDPTFNTPSGEARLFSTTYRITYTDGQHVDRFCDESISTCDLVIKTRDINLFVKTKEAPAKLSFDLQNYEVTVDPIAGTTDEELLVDVTALPYYYIGNPSDPDIEPTVFSSIKIANPSPAQHFYERKRFIIKNETTEDIQDLRFILKGTPMANTPYMIVDTQIQLDISDCNPKFTSGGLAAGESCYIEIFYQPNVVSATETFNLAFVYQIDDNQYVEQSIPVEFKAVFPATVSPYNISLSTILRPNPNGPGTMLTSSYPLNFASYTLTTIQGTIDFDGTFKAMTELRNSSSTRASFLKQWHDFRGLPVVQDNQPVLPEASDYEVKSTATGPRDFLKVLEQESTHSKITVYLSKECLMDDEPTIAWDSKGFNNQSQLINPCYMATYLLPKINLSGVSFTTSNVNHGYFDLLFYNHSRVSFDRVPFHFIGSILPNPSTHTNFASSPTVIQYDDVTALSNGSITFGWNPMTPNNIAFGTITGYRVFYAESASVLSNLYTTNAPYFDVRNLADPFLQINSLLPGKFYYIRTAAIRYSPNYTQNLFTGLTNEYLSVSTGFTAMMIVVPPANYTYHHLSKRIYHTKRTINTPNNYSATKSACGSLYVNMFSGSNQVPYQMKLIDNQGLNYLLTTPNTTNYDSGGFDTVIHWIDNPLQTVESYGFPMLEHYDANHRYPERPYEVLIDDLGVTHHYLREGSSIDDPLWNAPLAMFYGRYKTSTHNPGMRGLLPANESFKLGYGRCFVQF
jgi:hypothetical protein